MDARVIMDGPGSAEEPIQNLICGVISAAKKSVTIFTPYFLPTRELVISLGSAAARGISVRVVLPDTLDHPFVASAAEHMLPPILQSGVQVYRQPAPFAHTKLILINDMYTFLGSTNLDPRSLSLNFELNMEVFSYELSGELNEYARKVIEKSRLILPEDYNFDNSNWRTLATRLKNAAMWVISPYL
jgi:cardiolipin synthase